MFRALNFLLQVFLGLLSDSNEYRRNSGLQHTELQDHGDGDNIISFAKCSIGWYNTKKINVPRTKQTRN